MRRGLTEAERAFLNRVQDCNRYYGLASSRSIGPADRKEDQARQSCRRQGLVEWVKTRTIMSAGWRITDAGRAALAMQEGTDG